MPTEITPTTSSSSSAPASTASADATSPGCERVEVLGRPTLLPAAQLRPDALAGQPTVPSAYAAAATLVQARRRLAFMDLREDLDRLSRLDYDHDSYCEDCAETVAAVDRIRRALADLGIEMPA